MTKDLKLTALKIWASGNSPTIFGILDSKGCDIRDIRVLNKQMKSAKQKEKCGAELSASERKAKYNGLEIEEKVFHLIEKHLPSLIH